MSRRVINVLLGGAITSAVALGLLLQGWATFGREGGEKLIEARLATLLGEQKYLSVLLESERKEKTQLLQKYEALQKELENGNSARELLKSQLSEERNNTSQSPAHSLHHNASSDLAACAVARDLLESQLSTERRAREGSRELVEAERREKELVQRNFSLEQESWNAARELLESQLSRERAAWSRAKALSEAEMQKKADDALSECVHLERELQNLTQGWAKGEAAEKCRQHCAIIDFSLGFDVRFAQKAEELQRKIAGAYPTFEELYALVINRPYNASDNVWHHFPNPYNMSMSFAFPFSNLLEYDLLRVFEKLGRPPLLMVEVGSFHGHSAIKTAKLLDKVGLDRTPLLCIDPWAGDLGELLYRDDWESKIVPGEITDGRSTSYFQFMLNIKSQIDLGEIGPHHIVPLAVTSLVGARYLMALKIHPDIVYLDSAHEMDETFTEVSLYYSLLADGGILFGDDFLWYSVSADVKRFAEKNGLDLTLFGNCWMIQKPASSAVPKFDMPQI